MINGTHLDVRPLKEHLKGSPVEAFAVKERFGSKPLRQDQ